MNRNMTLYNRPSEYNVSYSKNRELFTDYGHSCIRNLDEYGQLVNNGLELTKYAALHPTLPLSSVPKKVSLPLTDRIIGHIVDENKSLKYFSSRVKNISRKKNCKRYKSFDDMKSAIAVDRENQQVDGSADGSVELAVEDHVDKLFSNLMTHYSEIKDSTGMKLHNYRYNGGCLAVLPKDDSHFFTLSADKIHFKTIELRQVSQKSEGLLQAFNVHSIKTSKPILGVQAKHVQGEDICAVRTLEQCSLYKIKTESDRTSLHQLYQCDKDYICSIDISPYIPGECSVIDEGGHCYLLSDGKLDQVAGPLLPRFEVSDPWRHIQYGSHPRQLLYADQSLLQLLDLRVPNSEGHDLFALPSKFLHTRERIRHCGRLPTSSFYHLMSTDYNLMILDERYTKYPVLKWEHMLSSPPQYMSSVQHETSHNDNFIYLSSQFPTDVHGFRFTVSGSHPPTAVSWPHRSAKVEDMCLWPQFVENCPNKDILQERLGMSLAGMACMPLSKGHAVIQLTCHGDLFHQVFLPSDSPQDITFSAGLMSTDLQLKNVAIETAKSWIDSWVTVTKQELQKQMMPRDVHMDKWGVLFYRQPHKSCCVCQPELQHMPGDVNPDVASDSCATCMTRVRDGRGLMQSADKDSITPNFDEIIFSNNLLPVDQLPKGTALSKLICCHWNGDLRAHYDSIMEEWNDEVKFKRKTFKNKKSNVDDMAEAHVLNRIMGKYSQQTGVDGGSSLEVHGPTAERLSEINTGQVTVDDIQTLPGNKGCATTDVFDDDISELSNQFDVATLKSQSFESDVLGSVSTFDSNVFGDGNSSNKGMFSSQKSSSAKKTKNSQENIPQNKNRKRSTTKEVFSSFKVPSSVKKSKRRSGGSKASVTDKESVNQGSESLFDSQEQSDQMTDKVSSDNSSVLSVTDLPCLKPSNLITHGAKSKVNTGEEKLLSPIITKGGTASQNAIPKSQRSTVKRKLYKSGF